MNDAVDWLNENAGAVQAVATIVVVAVTAIYAALTRAIATATKRQAEAVLTPVLDQYIDQTKEASGSTVTPIRVKYRNLGDGPALNIAWCVSKPPTNATSIQRRNGMGPNSTEGFVDFKLETAEFRKDLVVVAEYETAFGVIWSARLPLKSSQALDTGEFLLENDASEIEVRRIKKRTF
jgi:hypothetical protein